MQIMVIKNLPVRAGRGADNLDIIILRAYVCGVYGGDGFLIRANFYFERFQRKYH